MIDPNKAMEDSAPLPMDGDRTPTGLPVTSTSEQGSTIHLKVETRSHSSESNRIQRTFNLSTRHIYPQTEDIYRTSNLHGSTAYSWVAYLEDGQAPNPEST